MTWSEEENHTPVEYQHFTHAVRRLSKWMELLGVFWKEIVFL
jgi:hypothetical protein